MDVTTSFGYWVRRRRKALDLTQRALADLIGCAVVTVKKIEADARQPSQQLAERFATVLSVPPEEQAAFLARARGLLPAHQVAPVIAPVQRVPASAAPLPTEQTPFVGREAELQQLATLLADPGCRLLTLVGPGGIGKTRLALRAAATAPLVHSACFVPLADIALETGVALSVAARLGLRGLEVQHPEQALIAFLRTRELLLILDNAEHLVADDTTAADGLPALLSRILAACPQVRVLVTSRERLQLQAEWLFPIEGLAAETDALALFVVRAQRLRPTFAATGQESIIADICQLAEGLPLAIELAASWTPFLSCVQIKQRLAQDSELLATRLRDVPERHRSLRTVFDQSWNLLSDAERQLFAALSVFRGSFAAEHVGAVCGASVETLLALMEKSLVTGSAGRYGLHELARRYAAEQLAATGTAAMVQERHCNVYLALVENAARQFAGPAALPWFNQLDQEQENLRAALQWSLHQPNTVVLERFAGPLARYWYARGHWQAGISLLQAIVARLADVVVPAHVTALCWCGMMLARSGRAAEAVPYFRSGYALAQQTEDPGALGLASLVMAAVERDGGKPQRQYQAATELFGQANDDEGLAMALYFWGDDLRMQNDIPAARVAYSESLRLYRQMGNVMFLAYPLGNLGRLALLAGDVETAQRNFSESVVYARQSNNRIGLVDWLMRLGSVVFSKGDPQAARIVFQEAYTHARDIAYLSIIPHIEGWLALAEDAVGNTEQAIRYLQQSLAAYQASFADAPDISRVDVFDALVVAAAICTRSSQFERAVVLLSGVEQLARSQGHRLDQPLAAIAAAARSNCQTALNNSRYEELWQTGQTTQLDALLRLAASYEPET